MSAEIAVLTGDIVKSQKLPPGGLDRAFEALARAAGVLERFQGDRPRLTRFRGDGWQMAVTAPRLTLRSTLLIRAALRSLGREYATRIGVGLGPAAPLPDDLSGAGGAAFVASGRALEALATRRRIAAGNADRALAAALILTDALAEGWSPAQAEALFRMLSESGATQDDVSVALQSSRQNVQKLLDAAGFDALDPVLGMFEADDES